MTGARQSTRLKAGEERKGKVKPERKGKRTEGEEKEQEKVGKERNGKRKWK